MAASLLSLPATWPRSSSRRRRSPAQPRVQACGSPRAKPSPAPAAALAGLAPRRRGGEVFYRVSWTCFEGPLERQNRWRDRGNPHVITDLAIVVLRRVLSPYIALQQKVRQSVASSPQAQDPEELRRGSRGVADQAGGALAGEPVGREVLAVGALEEALVEEGDHAGVVG